MANRYTIPELGIGETVPVEFEYTVTDADVSDGLTISAIVSAEGAETSASIEPPIAPPAKVDFETATWQQIAESFEPTEEDIKKSRRVVLKEGYGEGDVRILGINHDDLADGSGKAKLSLEFRWVITGSDIDPSRYQENATMERIYALLPDDLRPYVAKVRKPGYANYPKDCYVWTPSYKEITGYSSDSGDNGSVQYAAYVGSAAQDRIKNNKVGSPAPWNSRSCDDDDGGDQWAWFMQDGSISRFTHDRSPAGGGSSPGFCIG